MKRLFNYTALLLVIITAGSCSKIDNYPAPNSTITGSVTDVATGKGVQTEAGSNGTRVKLLEISYSANPTPEYFVSKQDGTFTNTKVFKATYKISVEGPFVPLVQTDATGNVISDKSQTVNVSGTATVNFKVEPFLDIEYVGSPVVNSDGTISISFKINRGTTNPAFQLNLSEYDLFINSNPYVGNNNYDNRYWKQVTFNGTDGNAQIGQTITLTTTGGKLPGARNYYVRIGARITYGLNYYNYTDAKTVAVP
jgi:hypothetical protein